MGPIETTHYRPPVPCDTSQHGVRLGKLLVELRSVLPTTRGASRAQQQLLSGSDCQNKRGLNGKCHCTTGFPFRCFSLQLMRYRFRLLILCLSLASRDWSEETCHGKLAKDCSAVSSAAEVYDPMWPTCDTLQNNSEAHMSPSSRPLPPEFPLGAVSPPRAPVPGESLLPGGSSCPGRRFEHTGRTLSRSWSCS